MTRFLSLLTAFLFVGIVAFSQNRVVTGRVTDVNGKPVPYASVTIKGGKAGVQSDVNGEFSISVAANDVLVFSQSNYVAAELTVGTASFLTAELKQKEGTLKEVVVTSAFQTRRTLRSQSSNVQSVNADQLNTVRASNVNNALAGKVAGIQVLSQSALALGRDTKIRLRGENSLSVGSGPIYVVDGTIITSSGDINPDDIENITVLQGPSSAGLFGPDGANGAIVITTKKGKKNGGNLGVEVNLGYTVDQIGVLPKYQNTYAGGSGQDMFKYEWQPGQPIEWKALDGKYYHNYDDDASWGPRMVGQEYIPWYAWYGGHADSYKTGSLVAQPDNGRNFFSTGSTKTSNISVSKSTDNLSFRVSYTNLDVNGLIPNQYLKKNTLNTSVSINITPKLTFASNITYVNQRINADNDDGYSNKSSGSFNQWFHRDLDINKIRQLRGLKTPQGVYASWNISNPDSYDPSNPSKFYKGNYWFNPYTWFDLIQNYDEKNRLFGDISLAYKINNDLSVKATYRKQQLNTAGYNVYPTELQESSIQSGFNPYGETTAESNLASYQTNQFTSSREYYEGLLTYSKKIKDFQLNANAGFVFYKLSSRYYAANTSGGLSLPGVYSLANSVNQPKNDGSTALETITNYKSRALFVRADLGYKNYAFIEGSYRRDYTSAEPKSSYIETKSFGASLVFSDLIEDKSILSFGKVRFSWGQILNTLNPYDLGTYYTVGENFNGKPTMAEPNALVDPALHGAANDEKEIGVDLRFLKNRLGVNFTYYTRVNKDFPVAITTSGTTGYTSIKTNAGQIDKQGVELQLNGRIIDSKNFAWDMTTSWSYILKNKVISIAKDGSITRLVSSYGAYGSPTTTSQYAAWTVSEVGEEWGQLHGTGIKRIDGKPVLNADGTYVSQADVNYGSVLPKYTGGFQNTFNIFKNIVVNVNIDYSVGGKFFSLSSYWGDYSGLTARTAELNDKNIPVRELVANGGGVHVYGVDKDGKDFDTYMEAKDYFDQFPSSKISEKSVFDLTYVKMRELSIGYNFPMEKCKFGKFIKGATVSFIGRNLWLMYSKTDDFDPSEISGTHGEDGQLPGTRSYGVNLKLNF